MHTSCYSRYWYCTCAYSSKQVHIASRRHNVAILADSAGQLFFKGDITDVLYYMWGESGFFFLL